MIVLPEPLDSDSSVSIAACTYPVSIASSVLIAVFPNRSFPMPTFSATVHLIVILSVYRPRHTMQLTLRNNNIKYWPNCVVTSSTHYYAPVRREGAISVVFVSPSVCPSVAYIANNSRTQMPSVPKFGRKVSHASFIVKRSKIKVTRHIIADTHRVPYLPNSQPMLTPNDHPLPTRPDSL